MAEVKTVAITLGGRERHLRYDVNALIDLGEELGLNLLTKEGWEQLAGKADEEGNFVPVEPSYKRVRAIIWAGLRHEDESLTVRQVGAWLNPSNLGEAIAAYQEAWKTSEGATEDAPKESS
jgi:hypothetical protein